MLCPGRPASLGGRGLQAYYRTYAGLLAQLLRESMECGEIRPGDPHRLVVALIAHIEGVILLWVMAPQVVDLESQWQTSTDLMLRSLLPDGAAAPPAQETLHERFGCRTPTAQPTPRVESHPLATAYLDLPPGPGRSARAPVLAAPSHRLQDGQTAPKRAGSHLL
ncbi:MAG TPA: hypothetical protein EYH28_05855 [Anaerolineaceae bacterium]|nr:hypothetical protein [Anaerolineales bacterium]HIQ09020.1 hypothetical protein [Anaerolineaceae bacterium]